MMAFELATWSRPKVGPDCHIKVGKALYSVPWRFIGRQVDTRSFLKERLLSSSAPRRGARLLQLA
jgi:hypothetical protein